MTVETIQWAKKAGKEVLVGGILASVLPKELEKATGIKPHIGCLHVKNLPGDAPLEQTIEELPLDYSMLDEIDYKYPAQDAYYAYATRGCVNKCGFCAVPTLEPEFIQHIPLAPRLDRCVCCRSHAPRAWPVPGRGFRGGFDAVADRARSVQGRGRLTAEGLGHRAGRP
jgi:hypothetical protein